MKLSAALVCSVFTLTSLVNAIPTGVVCPAVIPPTPPVTACTNGTAVYGLQLSNQGGIATLTKAGLDDGWNFGNGGLGYPWCPTSTWLNIVDSIRPWKPLVWGRALGTSTWKAGYSQYLTATATKTYAETDEFLACKPLSITASNWAAAPTWTLFLLTDGTLPTASDETLSTVDAKSCVKTKLYIGPGWTSIGSPI
ncbi:hypothetical protein FRC04_010668 [Tulasnella sp. 424]|nr:hypothetical protein FRC04_010668 [Tulasnella sp. 424]KAG8972402.1 hypothetical protein FRC05_010113 [Tulasnella sp. 425]